MLVYIATTVRSDHALATNNSLDNVCHSEGNDKKQPQTARYADIVATEHSLFKFNYICLYIEGTRYMRYYNAKIKFGFNDIFVNSGELFAAPESSAIS